MGWWKGNRRNRIGDGPADRLSAVFAETQAQTPITDMLAAYGAALRASARHVRDPERLPASSIVAVLEPGELEERALDGAAAPAIERWCAAIADAATDYRDGLERLPTVAELLETFVFVARGQSNAVPLWSLHADAADAAAELERCRKQRRTRGKPVDTAGTQTSRRDAVAPAGRRGDIGPIPDVATTQQAVEAMRRGVLESAFASYSLDLDAEPAGLDVLRGALEPIATTQAAAEQEQPLTTHAMLQVGHLRSLATRATNLALSEARALRPEDLAQQLWRLVQAAFVAGRPVRGERAPEVVLDAAAFATAVIELLAVLAGDAQSGVLGPPSGTPQRDGVLRRGLAVARACGVWATALLETNPPQQPTSIATLAPLLVLARFIARLAPWDAALDVADAASRLHAWNRVDAARRTGVATRADALARLIAATETRPSFTPGAKFTAGQLVQQKKTGVTVVLATRHPNVLVAAIGRWGKQHLVCAPSFLAPVVPPAGVGPLLLGSPEALLVAAR